MAMPSLSDLVTYLRPADPRRAAFQDAPGASQRPPSSRQRRPGQPDRRGGRRGPRPVPEPRSRRASISSSVHHGGVAGNAPWMPSPGLVCTPRVAALVRATAPSTPTICRSTRIPRSGTTPSWRASSAWRASAGFIPNPGRKATSASSRPPRRAAGPAARPKPSSESLYASGSSGRSMYGSEARVEGRLRSGSGNSDRSGAACCRRGRRHPGHRANCARSTSTARRRRGSTSTSAATMRRRSTRCRRAGRRNWAPEVRGCLWSFIPTDNPALELP